MEQKWDNVQQSSAVSNYDGELPCELFCLGEEKFLPLAPLGRRILLWFKNCQFFCLSVCLSVFLSACPLHDTDITNVT